MRLFSSQHLAIRACESGSKLLKLDVSLFRRFAGCITAVLALACTPDYATAPHDGQTLTPARTPTVVDLPPVRQGDSATADSLARGVARSLARPDLRQLVFADLRDSPFPRHAIDLTSYLQGTHASALIAAIGLDLGVRPEHVVDMAKVRGGLELVMPIAADRATWAGNDSIVVVGSAYTVAEDIRARHQPFAYTVRGQTVPSPLLEAIPAPRLALEPTTYAFGSDPEATRLGAPGRSRATVSTFAEGQQENYLLSRRSVRLSETAPCNNQTIVQPDTPCSFDPGQGSFGAYLPSGSTFTDCVPNGGDPMNDVSQDQDRDGVRDSCEYEIAQAFHPQMQFTQYDCDTSREPYWAVTYQLSPIDGTRVISIFYAIAYHQDCGDPEGTGVTGHLGDSEFIVVEVSTDGGPSSGSPHWLLVYATLSAHYRSPGESTGTYAGMDLEYGNAPVSSNPLVWVSVGKHGNYRSQSACGSGAYYQDNCDNPGERVGLEVLPSANLGSSYYKINDVVQSRVGGMYSGTEYMWAMDSGHGFLGWFPRSNGNGETPYGTLLADFGWR